MTRMCAHAAVPHLGIRYWTSSSQRLARHRTGSLGALATIALLCAQLAAVSAQGSNSLSAGIHHLSNYPRGLWLVWLHRF